MQSKFVITGILLLFVVVSVVVMAAREMTGNPVDPSEHVVNSQTSPGGEPVSNDRTESEPEPTIEPAVEPVADLPTDGIVAYYFHGYARCHSCIMIETLTDRAIRENFSDELENGSLIWKVVNVEEPSNEHFVVDYQLYTRSVVLAEFRDGSRVRWKNLDRVWRLFNNEVSFSEYIRDEVGAYLGQG